jgi:hypothetical protein
MQLQRVGDLLADVIQRKGTAVWREWRCIVDNDGTNNARIAPHRAAS